jgi:hypothetical protein
LQPEEMVFADKALLYREEKKERPVLFMRWQRIAVAAALIGLAVLTWFLLPSGNKLNERVVAGTNPAAVSPGAGKSLPAAVSGNALNTAYTIANCRYR